MKKEPDLNSKFVNCTRGTAQEYQFGRGILKMVGPKKQGFGPRINILKGFFLIG